jgi:hypothetical protein
MAATTVWWVVVPLAQQNVQPRPPDAMVVSTQVGSAFYNTLLNTDSGTVTASGKQWVRYMGPFNSQAEAQSAAPGPIGIGNWVAAGIAGTMIGAGGASPTAAVNTGTGIVDALGGFNLEAWFMRIGEILLGLVLVGVGIARITGAQNAISKIVKTKMPPIIPV